MGAARALGVAGPGAGAAAAGAVLTGAAAVVDVVGGTDVGGIDVDDEDDGTDAGGDASSVVVRPSTVTGCCWPATKSTALQEQAASSSTESSTERLRRPMFSSRFAFVEETGGRGKVKLQKAPLWLTCHLVFNLSPMSLPRLLVASARRRSLSPSSFSSRCEALFDVSTSAAAAAAAAAASLALAPTLSPLSTTCSSPLSSSRGELVNRRRKTTSFSASDSSFPWFIPTPTIAAR